MPRLGEARAGAPFAEPIGSSRTWRLVCCMLIVDAVRQVAHLDSGEVRAALALVSQVQVGQLVSDLRRCPRSLRR
jgi:hypothetical protein